jgi:hypothetical protein
LFVVVVIELEKFWQSQIINKIFEKKRNEKDSKKKLVNENKKDQSDLFKWKIGFIYHKHCKTIDKLLKFEF